MKVQNDILTNMNKRLVTLLVLLDLSATIRVGDCDVGKVSVVRNLGAWCDDQLNMAVHITKICSAAFYHLHNIRCIRKHLSMDSAATLIHSFISSRIALLIRLFG